MRPRNFAILLLLSFTLSGQQDVDSYRVEKEAALGKRLATEVRRRTVPFENAMVHAYLDRLGRRLAGHMPAAAFPFEFSVIASDVCATQIEPYTLPGGYVFVPAALFTMASDEAEFAGMLGHAMTHIERRDWMRLSTRTSLSNHGGVTLIFMGGWDGRCPEGLAVPLAFREQQRKLELEADSLAMQTMVRAGFHPKALVSYIERVRSPLPGREERLAYLRSLIETLPAVQYSGMAASEFAAVQQEVQHHELPMQSKRPPSLLR